MGRMEKIMNIKLIQLKIPFKNKFSHANHSREISENALAILTDENDLEAFGESCPREYVTGETFDSISNFINSKEILIFIELKSVDEIEEFKKKNVEIISLNPAGFCCVEMALLNYFSLLKSTTIEKLLNIKNKNNFKPNFKITTMVIGLEAFEEFEKKIKKYFIMGYIHFKIKIKSDANFLKILKYNLNRPIVKWILQIGGTFRLDGNNCFKDSTEVINYCHDLEDLIVAIEEPLFKNDYSSLAYLLDNFRIPIIVDDSFVLLKDLDAILNKLINIKNSSKLILNIRISKNGGILNCLEIIKICEKLKIRYIIGSQVGETSLLTRAALCVINMASYKPLYFEGGFSKHLLTHDPFFPNLSLSFFGKIKNYNKVVKKIAFGLKYNSME